MKGFIEVKKNGVYKTLVNINAIASMEDYSGRNEYGLNTLLILRDESGTYVWCEEQYDEIMKAIEEASK